MQRLTIKANVTREQLTIINVQLQEIMLQRFLKKNKVFQLDFYTKKIEPVLFIVIRALSVLLFIISGILMFLPQDLFDSHELDIAACLGAAAFFFIFSDRNRNIFNALLAGLNAKLFTWAAKTRATTILKQAKKLAPFQAEYDFHGNSLTYYRTKDDSASQIWNIKIKGYFMVMQGFTLLFRDETKPYPYSILLCSTEELVVYLVEEGCLQLPAELSTN